MALRYFNIKTDKERINVEFYIMGVPWGENNSPRDRYIMDQKKYIELLRRTCDSLNINETTTVLVDSSEVKVNLSIDDFETANSLMKVLKKNDCKQFNASFLKNGNHRKIILNIKAGLFPRYKYTWIKRSQINIQNSNKNITFFPNESTDCLEVDQKSGNEISYSVLHCNGNQASPLQKITIEYDTEVREKETKSKEFFGEHIFSYTNVILGIITGLIVIFVFLKGKKDSL